MPKDKTQQYQLTPISYESWSTRKMVKDKILILVSGKARSGKNTIADFMTESLHGHGYSVGQDYISKDMKSWASEDFSRAVNYINNSVAEVKAKLSTIIEFNRDPAFSGFVIDIMNGLNKVTINQSNWHENKTDLSRILLQTYGTSIFQNRVDTNFWDSKLRDRIEAARKDVIIVTDVRFPSNVIELSKSKNFKTYTVRLERNVAEGGFVTETAMDSYKCDYTVENNSELVDLKKSASKIVSSMTGFSEMV